MLKSVKASAENSWWLTFYNSIFCNLGNKQVFTEPAPNWDTGFHQENLKTKLKLDRPLVYPWSAMQTNQWYLSIWIMAIQAFNSLTYFNRCAVTQQHQLFTDSLKFYHAKTPEQAKTIALPQNVTNLQLVANKLRKYKINQIKLVNFVLQDQCKDTPTQCVWLPWFAQLG